MNKSDQIIVENVRFESLLRSFKDGVVFFDNDKKVIIANSSFSKMTGLPEAGFHLDELTKLFKKEGLDFEEKLKESTRTRKRVEIQNVQLFSFIYDVDVYSVHDKTGNIAGGAIIIRDVTELYQSQEEIKQQVVELEKLNRFMVARELKMKEIKEEVKELRSKKKLNPKANKKNFKKPETSIDKLQKKNKELEELNKIMVGREVRMLELKKEIEQLKKSHKHE